MLGRSMRGSALICSSRYVPMFPFRIRLTDTGHSTYFEDKIGERAEAAHRSCAERELEMWSNRKMGKGSIASSHRDLWFGV